MLSLHTFPMLLAGRLSWTDTKRETLTRLAGWPPHFPDLFIDLTEILQLLSQIPPASAHTPWGRTCTAALGRQVMKDRSHPLPLALF